MNWRQQSWRCSLLPPPGPPEGVLKRWPSSGLGALFILASGVAWGHEVVDFEREVKPILQRSCGGLACHLGQKTNGVDLTTYETILASAGIQYGGPVVIPGDPQGSPLMDKVSSPLPRFGLRMPFEGDQLPEGEIAVLHRWIQEGARKVHHLLRGDADLSDTIDISDAIAILFFLFQGAPELRCPALADVEADGKIDLTDAIYLLNYLFLAGPAPLELTHAEEEACQKAGELSFASIYQKVFAPTCAFSSCHSAVAQKGGMNLATKEEAHLSLVGVAPQNEAAQSSGLLRVAPGKPEVSFLLKKLTGPGPGEGNRMPPVSSTGLSPAVIAAIREWILAGAPLEGTIAGVPDLADEPPPPIDRLPAPPKPENGIQLHLPPFTIGARREREIFYFLDRPLAALPADPVVERIDIHMSEESHHFILYEFIGATKPRAGVRENSLTVNLLNTHRFGVASQQSFFSLAFPPGVGLKLSRNASFDLNSHYVNLNGRETLYGEVYINIFFAPAGSVTTLVKPLFDVNLSINVPPHQTATTKLSFPSASSTLFDPTLGSGGRVARETHIYSLSSHTHRHGIRFGVFLIQNGADVVPRQMVYDNLDWDDPLYKVFNPPLVLAKGQGLRFEVTHRYHDPPSASAPPLTFGPTSEDEMAILLGYYAVK